MKTLSSLRSVFVPLLCLLILLSTGCSEFKEVQVSQISGVKILKITDKGVDMEIGMKIKNPNTYSFTIYRSAFDIKLGGTDLGVATLKRKEKVQAGSEEVHTFLITTTFDKLIKGGLGSVMALFGSKNAEIEIKGNLKVGKFLIRKSIPIDRKQKTGLDNQAAGSLFNLK
ncbi:MAG TPA: LEA type 2 family protein [Bacteroidia bacterium]|jgi:LEA14-like dessication related protein|nr:LEA type 2 family protein [Bacteroidia bacterium]